MSLKLVQFSDMQYIFFLIFFYFYELEKSKAGL